MAAANSTWFGRAMNPPDRNAREAPRGSPTPVSRTRVPTSSSSAPPGSTESHEIARRRNCGSDVDTVMSSFGRYAKDRPWVEGLKCTRLSHGPEFD